MGSRWLASQLSARLVVMTLQMLTVAYEGWVVVVALSGEYVVVVEAGGQAHEVPLAYHRSLVACLLEQLGEGLLRAVEALGVVGKAVGVAMFASEHACSARPGERVGHEAVGEPHSTLCQAVDIGRMIDSGAVGGDGLVTVVITHYIYNVERLLLCPCAGCRQQC